MKTLKFKSLTEFQQAVEKPTPTLSTIIYESIQESYDKGEQSSRLFNVSLDSEQVDYEITLPKKQWAKALESCLKDFEAFEESDMAIDCYLLRKKLL